MKHTSKRILSVLICLLMVLSLLPVASFAATPDILYFAPNSNWTQANARFVLWTWSGSGSGVWTECKDSDGDGIYEADIPDGHDMVIFVRMDPNKSIDWNSKWNQSGNTKIPTDGKNKYVQTSGDWDGKGSWDYYEIPECYHDNHDQTGYCPDCKETVGHSYVEHNCDCGLTEPYVIEPGYYLVGSLSGNSLWSVDASAADRMFTATEDEGVLELVYTFTVGDEYKVVSYDGYGNITWPYGDNLKVNEAGELTMRFEPATGKSYFYHGCDHAEHDLDGNCTGCGEYVGHSYGDDLTCDCGAAVETITVYFKNDWAWTELNVHYWGSAIGDTTWPGNALEVYDEAKNVYMATVPADVTGIIFNGADGKQTPNIEADIADGNCYYMFYTEELGEHVLFDTIDNIMAGCAHESHDENGICTECTENVGHSFDENHNCTCGLIEEMVAAPGFYLVGTFGGENFWFVDASSENRMLGGSALEVEGAIVHEITYNFASGDEYKIVAFDGYGIAHWYGNGEANWTVTDKSGELTLIFEEYGDGTGNAYFYTECGHETHDVDGICTNCQEYVGHSFDGNACDCGKVIEMITVYFRNNWKWAEISVYYWGTEMGDPFWPGEAVSYYGSNGTDDIWTADVPADIDGLIFSGNTPDSVQTPNITDIADGNCYYMDWDGEDLALVQTLDEAMACTHPSHSEDGICDNCTEPVDHFYTDGVCSCGKIDPDACTHEIHDVDGICTNCQKYVGHSFDGNACDCGKVIEMITVYFRNNWKWSNVSVYYWGSELGGNAWPGDAMEVYGNNCVDDIYVATVPADIVGLIFTGTKDDGSGATDKTPDITDFSDGICYYMDWADGNLALSQTLEEAMACPHNIVFAEAVAPTCYENGNIEYWFCDICGQAWLDADCTLNTNVKAVVLPMAHGELIHVEAVEATCYADGNIEHWYCETCGQAWLDADCTLNTNLKSVVTPMAHGELIHVEAVEATCYADGNIEHWYCEACGQAWLDADCTLNTNLKAVVTPTQGHSYSGGICGNCGEADPDYVPPVELTKIDGLTALNITRNSFDLTWTAAEGVVKYWVYINGNLYTSTTGTSVTVANRKVNTVYSVYVIANLDDRTFLDADLADVITVTTEDYNYWSNAVAGDNSISVTYSAEDCTKAWFYYGTSADDLVLYASSTNGTFLKENLKEAPVYYVQIAYWIDGKVVYDEIQQVIFDNVGYIPV